MLDTRFPRPLGDIGHPESFSPFGVEVIYSVVAGASPRRVVEQRDPALIDAFIAAGHKLVGQGALRVGTSCGFLARFQNELSQALPVPVVSSSLLACASVPSPGILTFSKANLDRELLDAAAVPLATPIEGIEPGGELHRRILNDEPEMDFNQAEREAVEAAQRLIERHPSVRTIVLECTNLPPYRGAIEKATGRTAVDAVQLLTNALK